MSRLRVALAVAGALAGSGCASAPPRPTSADHGALVARVLVRGAVLRFMKDEATFGVVAKLGPDGRPQEGPGAASGYARDGYFYFFDLPPGRYALLSAGFRARGTRYRVELPEAEWSKRAAELKAGQVAFLGDYELDGRFPEFPEAVDRAAAVIGRLLTFFLRHPPLPRDADGRNFDSGPAAEGRALLSARVSLAGTQWAPQVAARLKALGTPEPVALGGGMRPKPLELRQEEQFAWRDVLEWGEPLRSPNGLEWRRPKASARAAVWFTTASAKGFLGWDEAVRQLRAAATVGGPARLEEVRVSTRSGLAGRSSRWVYPESSLIGSEQRVVVTETVLVPDGYGLYTARLRAERDEFDAVLPAFRRLLEQLVLGPPPPVAPPKQDAVIFYPE
ncbi:MAG: hypothetical protein SF051_12770 [Elusimicrobiota bacterium]|nr:hypothetical protein [Elusimicrobiota bacterium]